MPRRPNILLLVTSSAWGGAERYVSRLARAAMPEFDVTVAAGRSPNGELFSSLPPGVGAVEIPELVRQISPLNDLLAIRALRRLIERGRFDILHANSSKAGLLGALAARRSTNQPRVIYTAHGWGFLERRSLPFRLLLLTSEKVAARMRDRTITLSTAERDIALAHRLATLENSSIIPLGIDREEITFMNHDAAKARLSEACGTRISRLILGTIANAYPAKNLPMLFEVFESLASEFAELDLVILGDGPEMPRLRKLHDALPHRDRVHLPGSIRNAAELLKSFDIFALPSTKEGMPWTILEASLAELPIIATRVGAVPEMIQDRETGFLVEPGDPAAMRRAIRDILSNRSLYQKLKSGAPRIAERRSGNAMTHDVLAVYRSLTPRS